MSSTSFRGGPGDHEPSWANETLPLAVRKELLERELKKLGFRKSEATRGGAALQQQQQQQQPPGEHAQAGGAPSDHAA